MSTAAKEILKVTNLGKAFKSHKLSVTALDDITLSVNEGELVSIIGTSGCGKTTLLRIIAGLESESSGSITLNGKAIRGPGADRAVIFQEHRLFPWYTVEENVGFGLRSKNDAAKQETIEKYIKLVGLTGFEKAHPNQISGGMSQRAAIARALVGKPEVLLLDGPLGALDALTRMHMQKELERIWRVEKSTMIMVTNDIEEAIYLSDKIVVMSNRPGTIKKVINIPMARPRDRASYDFLTIKEEVLKEFHLEAERVFSYSI